MITVCQVWNEAAAQIPALLIAAGLADGMKLNDASLMAEKKIVFWELKARPGEASKKATYVTWNIVSISPDTFGDGSPIRQKVVVSIEIFSNASRNSDTILELVSSIETQATALTWQFAMERGMEPNNDLQLFAYAFTLTSWIS